MYGVWLLQDALPVDTTPLTLVSTEEQLMKLCDILKAQTEIAVDTEVSTDWLIDWLIDWLTG